jgi:hypothetical protein
MGFFLLCGKQVKIYALILLIFLLYFIHLVRDRMGFVSSLKYRYAIPCLCPPARLRK